MPKYDFAGWATKSNIVCGDGRIIMPDAFKQNDGKKVPIMWNHDHTDPTNVLGHGYLENHPEGVYVYGMFNDSEKGQVARELVDSGDIDCVSIFATGLQQSGPKVNYGDIKEVSLVLAGANPGAKIESTIKHGDISIEEAFIYSGESIIHGNIEYSPKRKVLTHAEEEEDDMSKKQDPTVNEIIETMTEEQKQAMYYVVGELIEDDDDIEDDDEDEDYDDEDYDDEYYEDIEEDDMKHNFFESDQEDNYLAHSEELMAVITDAKRYGSLRDSALAHGITNIDYMFPDAMVVTDGPLLISRDMGWVDNVMKNTSHTPFSRIKSIFADITEDEARAKGYIKGSLKKDEVFSLLKRSTTPTTVYKKQKLDRDDVIDIADWDVVVFLKAEMRIMLNEELARAFLVGDGRLTSSDDKINETNIRPIWSDAALFTIKKAIVAPTTATGDVQAKAFIEMAIRSRKEYKGSGNPTGYFNEDMITECLLLKDTTGRDIYDSVEKLTTKLRLKEIVSVPVLENATRVEAGDTFKLLGIIVNLMDYKVGADKGGAINMFDDFDIDYNQQKYLIETRCSGALVKPYSAIAIEFKTIDTVG